MKRFMLLIREDLQRLHQLSDQQMQEEIAIMTRWVEDLTRTGNFIQGDPLEPEMRIATSNRIVSDGPFIESKEAISGFTLVRAENIDQATELAMSCPLVANGNIIIEVRPVLDI